MNIQTEYLRVFFIELLLTVALMSFVYAADPAISKDVIFTKLLENKADLTSGIAVFEFYCPLASCNLDDLKARFDVYKGRGIDSYAYYMETLSQVNKTVFIKDGDNCVNETVNGFKEVACHPYGHNETKQETVFSWKQIKGDSVPMGKYKIKLVANWKAQLGPVSIDWIPRAEFDKTKYSLANSYAVEKNDWAWWNYTFSQKQLINISNPTNMTLMGYVHRLSINTTNLYEAGKLQNDCDDLRFVNGTENVNYDFWIERCITNNNNTNSTVWVEMGDAVPTASSQIIYMYYNASAAASYSNGTDTFPFFDDFVGTGLSPSWTIVSSGITVSGGIAQFGNGGGVGNAYVASYGVNYHMRANVSFQNASSGTEWAGFSNTAFSNQSTWIAIAYHAYYINTQTKRDTTSTFGPDYGVGYIGQYKIYDVKRNNSASVVYNISDSTPGEAVTTNVNTASLNMFMYGCTGCSTYANWVFVRQWLYPDTSATFGATYGIPPSVTLYAPANSSTVNATPNVNFTSVDNLSATTNCTLYINGSARGTNATVLNNTYTNITTNTTLGMGTYYFNVTCIDGEGNSGSSDNRTMTVVDSNPPSVTLNSPINNQNVTDTTPDFNFTAVDNESTTENCTLYMNGTASGTNSTVSNNTATIITANSTKATGMYLWNVTCSDPFANTASSANRTLNIVSVATSITISVYDVETLAAIPFWNVTFSNSTNTTTFTNKTNPSTWSYLDIPNGPVTVAISDYNNNYYPSAYYETIGVTSNITLSAYLINKSVAANIFFYVLTVTAAPIQDATVSCYRNLGSGYVLIGEKKTDASGTAVIPLKQYTTTMVLASKSGYDTVNTSVDVSDTSYVFYLSTNYTLSFNDTFHDITWYMLPYGPNLTRGNNTITFYINSTDDELTMYGLNITLHNGTAIYYNTVIGDADGGIITTVIDLTNYTGLVNVTGLFTKSGSGTILMWREYFIYNYTGNFTLQSAMDYFASSAMPGGTMTKGIVFIFVGTLIIAAAATLAVETTGLILIGLIYLAFGVPWLYSAIQYGVIILIAGAALALSRR